MQESKIFNFLDPKEQLKDFILMQGYEIQDYDQPLIERVDTYTHEVALQVLTIIETRLEHVNTISQKELAEFILSDDWIEPVIETPRVLH